MGSLVAQFDGLLRCLYTKPYGRKLREFVQVAQKEHQVTLQYYAEVQRLQTQNINQQKELKSYELKLKNAREMLDIEKNRRMVVEKEKNALAEQINSVMDLLGRGHIKESQEKLHQLHYSFTTTRGTEQRHSIKDHSPTHLTTITEDHDTLGSVLSVSDIDLTEDDLEETHQQSGLVKKRKSSPERQAQPEELNSTHLRSGRVVVKKKKSSPERQTHPEEQQSPRKSEDRRSSRKSEFEAHNTKVKVSCYINGEEVKQIQSEVEVQPSAPILSSESGDDVQVKLPMRGQALQTPNSQLYTAYTRRPSTPVQTQGNQNQYILTPTNTPHTPLGSYNSASKINSRPHAFYTKNIYKAEHCQPCSKRIKFGKIALKCRDCRATCHPDCKESVPLPCVPVATTPTVKGQMGTIADYTPLIPPMVPALVVHCCNEVENRGLTEVGLYRVPGAEREVKDLKDRFLRGKGLPNLSQVEIPVICGTLKDFLRSLKEPLITHILWRDFVNAAERMESQDCNAQLYQAISDLPQPNRDTLAWVIVHLQRVAECPDCKMPVSNLSKVFGPTLIGYSVPDPDPQNMLQETRQQQNVMEKLLEISSEYWLTFINVMDENIYSRLQQQTTESALMLGGIPSITPRRRSILSRTPLQPRDTPKSRYLSRK